MCFPTWTVPSVEMSNSHVKQKLTASDHAKIYNGVVYCAGVLFSPFNRILVMLLTRDSKLGQMWRVSLYQKTLGNKQLKHFAT